MAEQLGRKVILKLDGTAIANARTKNLTINNSSVNITTGDDSGIQALLDEYGEKSVEISVDGIAVDTVLLDLANGTTPTASLVFDYTTYTITGTFFLTSYSEGQPYNDAVTFSASFSSSGAVVKAAV